MFFTDDPRSFFTLQIEQASGRDAEGIFEMMGKLVFQSCSQNFAKKLVQPIAFPPAIHVTLTQTERPLL